MGDRFQGDVRNALTLGLPFIKTAQPDGAEIDLPNPLFNLVQSDVVSGENLCNVNHVISAIDNAIVLSTSHEEIVWIDQLLECIRIKPG